MNRSARVALGFLIVSASASWFEIARLRYRVAALEQQGDRGEGVLGVLNTVLEDDIRVRREAKARKASEITWTHGLYETCPVESFYVIEKR